MTLKDELRQLDIDMKYGGKAYQTYYNMGLTIPFLVHIAKKDFGNFNYIKDIKNIEDINPIVDREALDNVGGVFKSYIDLTFINDYLNIDWFESLELILEGDGYINNTVPVDFYLSYKDIFIKYCEFILGKNNYNFEPTSEDIEEAKILAQKHTGLELNHLLSL